MVSPTLKGPFRIFYKGKPVRVIGEPQTGLKWEHVPKHTDGTLYETFESAVSHMEALQFAHQRDAEICPAAYTGKDEPVR